VLAAFLAGCLAEGKGDMGERRNAAVIGTNIYSDEQNVALIRSTIDGAAEMRFGNTAGEMMLSAWEPFSEERVWYLPGFNYKTQPVVLAQYRGPELAEITLQLPVHLVKEGAPEGAVFPLIRLPDRRASDDLIVHDFETWNERWATYQDTYGYGNVFFPMSHQPRGGVDEGGFVWTDASRWLVDAPETPDSILLALNYWRWLFPPEWRARTGQGENVSLSNARLEVSLRGEDLSLRGATINFWILCDGARWHLPQPLAVENGRWVSTQLPLPPDKAYWQLSWSRAGQPPAWCLDRVESYGFAFRGFERGDPPAGRLDLDRFRLTRVGASD
jgi:hypothetical protein